MIKTTQAVLAALVVVVGTSSAFAAHYPLGSHRMHHTAIHDPWFKPVHLDNPDVPAKTYFQQMQVDGH